MGDEQALAKTGWDQFIGYLEDDKVFLLYHYPKLYRISPKRALPQANRTFYALIQSKLPVYEHQRPPMAS